MAIISACLPTFAPLLRMGSSSSSRRGPGRSDDYYARSHSGHVPARYGVHRASASRGTIITGALDDDEVELTKGGRTFDSRGSDGLSSRLGTRGPAVGGIVVDTEVRVSSEEGPL